LFLKRENKWPSIKSGMLRYSPLTLPVTAKSEIRENRYNNLHILDFFLDFKKFLNKTQVSSLNAPHDFHLLHSNAFCEIAGFVNVVSKVICYIIGKKLQGNYVDYGRKKLFNFRDLDNKVGEG